MKKTVFIVAALAMFMMLTADTYAGDPQSDQRTKTPEEIAAIKAQSVMSDELRAAKKACSSKVATKEEIMRCVEERMGQQLPGGSQVPTITPAPTSTPTPTVVASPSATPTQSQQMALAGEVDAMAQEMVNQIQATDDKATIVTIVRDFVSKLMASIFGN